MNDILNLKGHFEQRKNPNRPGARNLPANQKIEVSHIINLRKQLEELAEYWKDKFLFKNALVSVHYKDVVAKSNRIRDLLSESPNGANESIVGAKFSDGSEREPRHIITYCIEKATITKTIQKLDDCISIIQNLFSGEIDFKTIEKINKNSINIPNVSKTKFVSLIVDCFYVDYFTIDRNKESIKNRSIVTLYKTDTKTSDILHQIGISEMKYQKLDETTFILDPDQFEILKAQAPYLIAMAVTDIAKLSIADVEDIDEDPDFSIPEPMNEPVIGVIDTHFDKHVYFSKWVEYKNMQSKSIELEPADYEHGTMVSSIIVDGPSMNPNLQDNCGRFKVRHFGVAKGARNSSSSIMNAVKQVVAENRDIKVWNFSLGSELEIDRNFISSEAAVLDKLQFQNDIIFIVSGTNKPDKETAEKKIGAPADSINSIVVNSVDFDGKPTVYSRVGPVLSFFNKPDVCYYGGTNENRITAYAPQGKKKTYGTSFAAPWVSRKIAFLVYKMGLSREVAKALLIDSAAGWTKNKFPSKIVGYGIVPKHIENIIRCENDEIKFVISGISELYDTYNYNIPVPIVQDMQPFVAKATLCYFPECSRNQGVDYTDTELDIHFGRIKDKGIKPINNNIQDNEGKFFLKEKKARQLYRKWDNVKLIGEEFKDDSRARKLYGDGLWGISLKIKERLIGDKKPLNFGLAITLKEIDGKNRLEEFIRLCSLRGWLVNRINVENQINIYTKAEEEIKFE